MPRKKVEELETMQAQETAVVNEAGTAAEPEGTEEHELDTLLLSMESDGTPADLLSDEADVPATEGIVEDASLSEPSNDADTTEPPKPKRAPRKRAAPASNEAKEPQPESSEDNGQRTAVPRTRAVARRLADNDLILTVDVRGEAETYESAEDTAWHEIRNAYRTRKVLTGILGGIEQTDSGKTLVVVDYKHFRVIIPLKEMMINLGRSPSSEEYTDLVRRQNKILGNMLGAEIDFVIKGIDSKTRSVVASRKEAMLKKRQLFYLDTDASGRYRIYEGRIVQCRVIAVAEKVIRVEIFGVETSIMARDLAWDWIGDAHDRFSVGDQILVRITSVRREGLEDISVKADVKSVSQATDRSNLQKCRIQSKYAGTITDVHNGIVYIRLMNGVNAIAHSCYDRRMPGKKDDVSFAVTKIDEERGVAIGIITRIIKQHL